MVICHEAEEVDAAIYSAEERFWDDGCSGTEGVDGDGADAVDHFAEA